MACKLALCITAVVASVAVATDKSDEICLLQQSAKLIKPSKTELASAKESISDSESSQTSVASKEMPVPATTENGMPNKMVVTLLEVSSLGFFGIDRIYLGLYDYNHLNIFFGMLKMVLPCSFGICAYKFFMNHLSNVENCVNMCILVLILLPVVGVVIWAMIDWFAIVINALTYQASINFLGMSFTWKEGSLHSAYVVAVIGLIFYGISCFCCCCLACCASVAGGVAFANRPSYGPPMGQKPPGADEPLDFNKMKVVGGLLAEQKQEVPKAAQKPEIPS